MRNIGGFLAQRKLTRSIISTLRVSGKPFEMLYAKTNTWIQMPEDDAEIEMFIKGISWKKEGLCRTALFNLIVPIVGNNVDLCLFNSEQKDLSNKKTAKEVLN